LEVENLDNADASLLSPAYEEAIVH